MKKAIRDTPMHKAWEKYKLQPYYEYWAKKVGLESDNPETEAALWWIFSKGYEAAIAGECSGACKPTS